MRLDDLFTVRSGISTTGLDVLKRPVADAIPFLRPASTQQRTIAGWVRRAHLPADAIHPAGTICVATNGEGSHSYAYVVPFEFACNSDVAVLTPRGPMTVSQKLRYAHCITLNRFRFSYGRKPKGDRLKALELPDVESGSLDAALTIDRSSVWGDAVAAPPQAPKLLKNPKLVSLSEIFDIRNGHGLDLASLPRGGTGGVRFVSRTKRNNGVSGAIAKLPSVDPHEGGALTCALNGEGGVLYTFLQDVPFYTAFHVAILVPKEAMIREELLFYCTCIRANRFKYSYGRQANRTLGQLKVPDRESIPTFVYGALRRLRTEVSLAVASVVSGDGQVAT